MEELSYNILKPSEIMRAKRPYLYSDSENTDAYRLSPSELSHQLDSLTDRNQHKDFENFARKVCEREIYPNLRPQTGPEGGGDGKVDTETHPVSTKISERWFVGDGTSGQEKCAFAFSAKKAWQDKVRSDVRGIVETKRGYEKIYFVTSRPIRNKDRLRIEDELTSQHGIIVTIFDREWLIDRVFSHNHKDLAFEHLNAGAHDPDSLKVGPNDFRRQQALNEIEDRLKNLGDKLSDHTQVISDTYEAASLSRRLEKPRYETEGRFQRATDVARKYGANYQLLRAVYEHAWTRFWWFDDVDGMQEMYEKVEQIAFATDLAHHISKVCNLLQLIVGRVLNEQEPANALSLYDRGTRLKSKLTNLAADRSRPNNALYAETLLVFHALNEKSLAGDRSNFDDTWRALLNIIERAKGLGEFPADLLDSVIDALSPYAPDSEVFDALVEKLAEFMSEREKELKAGQIYLNQGERKLEAEKPIDAIKWLGRAVVNFMKEESREEQFRALYNLAVGYRGAGLLWAARSAALAATTQAAALSELDAEVRIEMVPSLSLFTMISLHLGHITDFLSGVQYLQASSRLMPLDGGSRTRLQERFVEFDQLFACLLVDLPIEEIQRLSELPDILDRLHLFTARMSLLYRLGHLQTLRDDGSIPDGTTDEEIHDMISIMAAQPACRDLPKAIVLLDEDFGSAKTKIMGVDVRVSASGDLNGFLLAESHISFLEAFVSTLLNSGAFPHRESLEIHIEQLADANDASVEFIVNRGVLSVVVPVSWDPTQIDQHALFIEHLVRFGATALAHTVILRDNTNTLEQLVGIERAFDRATLFCRCGISRRRLLGGYAGKLSDWRHWIQRSYNLLDNAPLVFPKVLPEDTNGPREASTPFGELNSHRDLSVSSIINQDLWNGAGWQGMLYGYSTPDQPPFLGLMFGDEGRGRSIFEEWRKRFGRRDDQDEIRISVVKGIDRSNPFHYRGCICRDNEAISIHELRQIVVVSRMTTMTVSDHKNLELFQSNLERRGCYYLVPAFIGANGEHILATDHAILKRKFHVREAWRIGRHDIDAMAVRPTDDVVIPEGENNPPIHELFDWRREMEA
ncbi:hypothetical protein [Phyllobacterium endophyticum]|uniref:hypothetical protein n=1 Tax=Phyllobacterium endophyticum TaxID=1149773 RepID=UPI0011CBAF3A|nr:hypothetical protein [Phyllobacterium endophyticum]TXR50450.1 hypothetical protein FVA77_03940 [Phyllobacterium endophyticum]